MRHGKSWKGLLTVRMHAIIIICCTAEVTCRDAIRQARVTRNASTGMQALAKVNLKKSENGAHRVFREFRQALNIAISRTDLPTQANYPYIKFGSWLRYLVEFDCLDQLTGVQDLQELEPILHMFWQRYRSVHPEHVIFEREARGLIDLKKTFPCLLHGDEGRSLKKKQVMVVSLHGCLGSGSRPSNEHRPHDDDDNLEDKALQLNMLGSTIKSHFPSFIMPVSLYKDNDGAFYHMLELVAGELKDLFEDGLQLGGRKFFMCCLGVKGDAPFLAKAGRFNRSFTRRPTRPSSKKPATGLCHQCMAGNEELGIPFEDFGRERPQWLSTVGSVPAYSRAAPSPLLKIPFDGTDMSVFFRWDVFHNWHLGLGKTFITSAVCCVLELLNPLSLDAAFKVLTEDFGSYCQMNKQSPYHKKLTSQFFGVEASFQDWPDAGWSKGDFTRLICQWFEDYCSRKVVGHTEDPLYLMCVAMDPFKRFFYFYEGLIVHACMCNLL